MRNEKPRLKFIRPMVPAQILGPPISDDWLHEIKYDGFRTQVILDWAGARAFSRHGHDWSKRYWPTVQAAEMLPAKSFIIDGEMTALDADGKPNFHAMHSRMRWNAELLTFVAFDLLHLDGEDLRYMPLIERKDRLWDLVKPADGIIQYSVHVQGNGLAFFNAVEKMGLEGVVSKRSESLYRSGKTEAWVKAKCWEVGEFGLLGVRRAPGKPTVALVAREGKYAGSAILAANQSIREPILRSLEASRAKQPAGVPSAVVDGVQWVKPGFTARVRHLRGELKLRHATVESIRADEG
ncbi:ATP dependent DNA ligase [Mesorhizobium plurifarium]|uniref:ATP dependent DNA ligase n=1 Tax=Mesorhizobium plurifarium TaxID=69974 RepID=A0A090EES5_MESPL|nr:ATP dependent DNA ligase [Mesorhizobium plurifarium]